MTNVSSLVTLKATISLLMLIVLIATKLSFRNEIAHTNELRGARRNSRRLQVPPGFVIQGSLQDNVGSTPSTGSVTSTGNSGAFINVNGSPVVQVYMTSNSSKTDSGEPSYSYGHNVTIDLENGSDTERIPIAITMTGPDDVDPDSDTGRDPFTITVTGSDPVVCVAAGSTCTQDDTCCGDRTNICSSGVCANVARRPADNVSDRTKYILGPATGRSRGSGGN